MAGPDPDRIRLHAIVRGRVQGVNFRTFTAQHARRLGVIGTVRNLAEGRSVEVDAEGDRPQLEELLARLHEGPRFARVERIDVEWLAPRGVGHDFRVTE